MIAGTVTKLSFWSKVSLAGLLLVSLFGLTACSMGTSSPTLLPTKDDPNAFVVTPEKRAVTTEDLAYYSPQMKALYQRGTLKVAMPSSDRPPFFYIDAAGRLAGSDVDLAADMAAQLGVGVQYLRSAKSFDEVVNQVASGLADVAVTKLSATLPRAEKVLFSNPYLTLHQGLLLNRLAMARLGSPASDPLQRIRQADVKVGVQGGTSYVSFANLLFPKNEIVAFPSPQEMMDAAIKGDITALYYDDLQLKQLLAANPGRSIDLQLYIMEDQVDLISVAVPPNDVQLLGWVNLYLQSNKARIDSLLKKYEILPQ